MERNPATPDNPGDEPHRSFIDPVLEGLRKLLAGMSDRLAVHAFRNAGEDALGLNKSRETDVLDEVLQSEVEKHSRGITSKDTGEQAEAFRFFSSLGTFRNVGVEPRPDDPDMHFLTQPLSGEEAVGCLVGLLDGLPWSATVPIRQYCGLPEVEYYELPADAYSFDFTHQQAVAMAVSVGGNLEYAQAAAENGKLVMPDKFLASDDEKNEMANALGSLSAFSSSTHAERREVLDWVFNQLPHLLRITFNRQQVLKEQFGNETDTL
jgi:hypothetical protein